MKKIFPAAMIIGVFFFVAETKANNGSSSNTNSFFRKGLKTAGYFEGQYYYYPEIDIYYDITKRWFVYAENNRWIYSNNLPSLFRGYDVSRGYKVVINEYKPYLHGDEYREIYHNYYNNYNRRLQSRNDNRSEENNPQQNSRYDNQRNNQQYNRAYTEGNNNSTRNATFKNTGKGVENGINTQDNNNEYNQQPNNGSYQNNNATGEVQHESSLYKEDNRSGEVIDVKPNTPAPVMGKEINKPITVTPKQPQPLSQDNNTAPKVELKEPVVVPQTNAVAPSKSESKEDAKRAQFYGNSQTYPVREAMRNPKYTINNGNVQKSTQDTVGGTQPTMGNGQNNNSKDSLHKGR